jgi:outer membrane autotransporter protein
MQRIVAAPGLPSGIANGNTSANQVLGQVEAGYRFDLAVPERTSITPFGQFQLASTNRLGFT